MKRALVITNTIIADHTHELILQVDKSFSFVPGQYITVMVPLPNGRKTGRSYSIASVSSDYMLTLLIKLVDGGIGSQYLSARNRGEIIEFVGPIGKFSLADLPEQYLFVATGTGVAPFVSMIDTLLHKAKEDVGIFLLFGVRHEADIIYKDKFEQWQKNHPNFHFILTLSKPMESWQGERGRVTEYISQHQKMLENRQVYICGNGSMVHEVERICLENGIAKDHIFYEKYNNL